jgi:hypothetical protein
VNNRTAAPPDLDGLLARFVTWGTDPTVDGYMDLFAPGGTVFDAGMPNPVSGEDIRTIITNTLQLLDGFRLDSIRTGRNDTTLFVEANNTATIQGTPASWAAVYCMAASGDRVARGRRYYDQVDVLRSVLGQMPAEEPDEHAGPLEMSPTETGYGSAGCWFREWVGTAGPVGHQRSISAIERFADGDIAVFTDTLSWRPNARHLMSSYNQAITGIPR